MDNIIIVFKINGPVPDQQDIIIKSVNVHEQLSINPSWKVIFDSITHIVV